MGFFRNGNYRKIIYSSIFESVITVLGAVLLSVILGKNIAKTYTVWELGDEAGYLSNVAFFLGADWDDIRASLAYYAYGYSVFLIPVYVFAKTGVQLIRGSVFVNLIFAIGTYFTLIYLLKKVGKAENGMLVSAISFVCCLSSYLCCNVLKVDCESLSVFWYCITAVVLYKSMESKTGCWFFLLGVVSSFLFFIHTRMIVLIAAMFCSILIAIWKYDEKTIISKLSVGVISFLGCFVLGYVIKSSIVNSAVSLNSANNGTLGNLVNGDYITNVIKNLLTPENLKLYVLSFFAKTYYIMIASAGTVMFGCTYLYRQLLQMGPSKEEIQSYTVKSFLMLGMTLMIIVCILNGANRLDNYCYFFYSRYYENTVIPVMALSIWYLIINKWSDKIYFIFCMVEISVSVVAAMLKNYLYSDVIYIDTARIPGFSWLVKHSDDFLEMVLLGAAVSALTMTAYYIVSKSKVKKVMIPLLILAITWGSTSLGIEKINEVQSKAKPDSDIANQILDDEDCEVVYMVDDESYEYLGYYSRMQVLLKDIPVRVIHQNEFDQIDELPCGTWALSYATTTLEETYLSNWDSVMEGTAFKLWKKQGVE